MATFYSAPTATRSGLRWFGSCTGRRWTLFFNDSNDRVWHYCYYVYLPTPRQIYMPFLISSCWCRSSTCISYEAINRAFNVAKESTRLPAPAPRGKDLTDIEIDVLARTILEASRILAKESVCTFWLSNHWYNQMFIFVFLRSMLTLYWSCFDACQSDSTCRLMRFTRDFPSSTLNTRQSLLTARRGFKSRLVKSNAIVNWMACATIWKIPTGVP